MKVIFYARTPPFGFYAELIDVLCGCTFLVLNDKYLLFVLSLLRRFGCDENNFNKCILVTTFERFCNVMFEQIIQRKKYRFKREIDNFQLIFK